MPSPRAERPGPRPEDAPVGDWADVLRKLPARVRDWMDRLQAEGVRGAGLVFACIGPALEIFSRYSRVETTEGREVTLSEYLEKVWEVVGRTALENVLGTAEARARNGVAGALEEHARLTALFLWTLQATEGQNGRDEAPAEEDEEASPKAKKKGYSLVFDVVRRFPQPLVNPKVMLGKPVIRGTRIPVELILRKLGEGATEADLLDAYPQLTAEDIRAAVAYAADTLAHEETIFLEPPEQTGKG